ncbi:MAG: hypothetical protein ACKOD5_08150, partial [Chthoniobacterales bacterium]
MSTSSSQFGAAERTYIRVYTNVPLLLDCSTGAGKSGIGFQPMRSVYSLARMPMPRVFLAAQSLFA